LCLKVTYHSRAVWVPVDPRLKVKDLLAIWASRIRIQEPVNRLTLFLEDGELYEEDTLNSLGLRHRDVLTVAPRTENHMKPQNVSDFRPVTQQHFGVSSHGSSSVVASGKEAVSKPIPPSPSVRNASGPKFPVFFSNYENQKPIKPLFIIEVPSKKVLQIKDRMNALIGRHDEFHHMNLGVVLPSGSNENLWLAVYLISFYNNSNILYSKISPSCTPESCAHTSAGLQNYLWMDAVKKTPVDIPAPEYFNNLFEWIVKENFNDETKFPNFSSEDPSFPLNFMPIVADISRRIFRVYAHLYHHHYTELSENTSNLLENFEKSFELFYRFVLEYKLVNDNDLKPMEGLINVINM